MATEKDEAPPVEKPEEEPKVETEKPADQVAEEHHEKVPAWGESLIAQVESLGTMLESALNGITGSPEGGPGPDETPQRKPWHKRNPLSGD